MKKTFVFVIVFAFFALSAFTQTVHKINMALELQTQMELSKDKISELFKLRSDLQKNDVNLEAKLELAELDMRDLMRNKEENLTTIKAKLDEMALLRSERKFAQIEAEVKLLKMLDKKQESMLGETLEKWHATKSEKELQRKKLLEIRESDFLHQEEMEGLEKNIHKELKGEHGEYKVIIRRKGEEGEEVKKEIKVKKK